MRPRASLDRPRHRARPLVPLRDVPKSSTRKENFPPLTRAPASAQVPHDRRRGAALRQRLVVGERTGVHDTQRRRVQQHAAPALLQARELLVVRAAAQLLRASRRFAPSLPAPPPPRDRSRRGAGEASRAGTRAANPAAASAPRARARPARARPLARRSILSLVRSRTIFFSDQFSELGDPAPAG